ncbi:hypothetical protein M2323_000757 [Rhodoblastus acidophilus]|nr:hypothetical protein [Rhodoblastus acidophilus]MCW2331853.1 hypothetical protein [Rhodoblastus acidophilus]
MTKDFRRPHNSMSSWPGVVPAIHAAPQRERSQNFPSRSGVDARDKPGHDGLGSEGAMAGGFTC